jgi:hypothetical protein
MIESFKGWKTYTTKNSIKTKKGVSKVSNLKIRDSKKFIP